MHTPTTYPTHGQRPVGYLRGAFTARPFQFKPDERRICLLRDSLKGTWPCTRTTSLPLRSRWRRFLSVWIAAGVTLAGVAPSAQSTEAAEGPLLSSLRTGLADGVSIQAGVTLDALRNTRGGRARGNAPVMLSDLRIGLDLEKLAQLPGLDAYLHVMNHALERPNADRVGALTGVTNIEAIRNGTKLYRLWLERSWEDRGTAVRAGLFPLEDEFFTMEAAASFIHPTNGPQGDYAATVGAAIYNHAGFGVRVRQDWAERSRYAMLAILDRPLEDTNFVRWDGLSFPRAPGLQAMLELGLTPLAGAPTARGERFDKTAAGVWAYSRGDDHLSRRDASGLPLSARSYGWYALRERTLWHAAEAPSALAGFIRFSGGDGRAYPVDRAINTGLRLTGWVPGRSADTTAVMVVLQRLGEPWRERLRASGLRAAAVENVLEINHRIELAPSLAVMPLAQWIARPGGQASTASSRVLGLRVSVSL